MLKFIIFSICLVSCQTMSSIFPQKPENVEETHLSKDSYQLSFVMKNIFAKDRESFLRKKVKNLCYDNDYRKYEIKEEKKQKVIKKNAPYYRYSAKLYCLELNPLGPNAINDHYNKCEAEELSSCLIIYHYQKNRNHDIFKHNALKEIKEIDKNVWSKLVEKEGAEHEMAVMHSETAIFYEQICSRDSLNYCEKASSFYLKDQNINAAIKVLQKSCSYYRDKDICDKYKKLDESR